MTRHFDEIERDLQQPLDESRVRYREAGRGRQVPYIEGYDVIATANRIFGFDGWSYSVRDVHASTTTTGRIFYRAEVTVSALGVSRTDIGVSIVEVRRDSQEDMPDAHDVAIKGAVTDALKRAFRTFGAQFGNELYDKGESAAHRESRDSTRLARSRRAHATTVGDLLSWAFKEHGLRKEDVLARLGLQSVNEIGDLRTAHRNLLASLGVDADAAAKGTQE